jgi:membrane protein implicated in regulation of membrane protease activity
MKTDVSPQFEDEIRSFWILSILNLVFAAITMAYGIMFIVTRLQEMVNAGTLLLVPLISVIVGFAVAVLGIKWILASVEIFSSIEELKSAYDAKKGGMTPEDSTGFIIQMINQYRTNKATIRTMILVCTAGGCCFLVLGIMSSIEFVSAGLTSGMTTLNYLLIPSALLTLGIATVSLLCSYYFRKYASVWDRRLSEISRSENVLEKTMEQDSP